MSKKITIKCIKGQIKRKMDSVKETQEQRKARLEATDGGKTTRPKIQPSGKSKEKAKDIRNGRKNLRNEIE